MKKLYFNDFHNNIGLINGTWCEVVGVSSVSDPMSMEYPSGIGCLDFEIHDWIMMFSREKAESPFGLSNAIKKGEVCVYALNAFRADNPVGTAVLKYACPALPIYVTNSNGSGVKLAHMDDSTKKMMQDWDDAVYGPVLQNCDYSVVTIYDILGNTGDALAIDIATARVKILEGIRLAATQNKRCIVFITDSGPNDSLYTPETLTQYQLAALNGMDCDCFLWSSRTWMTWVACLPTLPMASPNYNTQVKFRKMVIDNCYTPFGFNPLETSEEWEAAQPFVEGFFQNRNIVLCNHAASYINSEPSTNPPKEEA